MNSYKESYYNLLCDFEDSLLGGFRRPRQKILFNKPGDPSLHAEAFEDQRMSRDAAFNLITNRIIGCRDCPLHKERKNAVPGTGSLSPRVMIIGEAPGADEDACGKPFVGKAGQYLDKWFDAIHLTRSSDIFIGNVIKCRPPQNRDPHPDEIFACLPYLEQQVDLLQPKAILTLGRYAIQTLTRKSDGIGRLRGETYYYRGIAVFPTYHPSGVLRNPEYRAAVWEDLKRLKEFIDAL